MLGAHVREQLKLQVLVLYESAPRLLEVSCELLQLSLRRIPCVPWQARALTETCLNENRRSRDPVP